MDFSGKTVLVTGASGGIGSVISRAFAHHGANVCLHYHKNRAAAEQLLDGLGESRHCLVSADLTDPEDCGRLVDKCVERAGKLPIVVNNAAVYLTHDFLNVGFPKWREIWETTISTNLLGPANVIFFAAKHMKEIGGGRIINVSSRGAFRGEPRAPAYAASKAALNALSQSAAVALAADGIFLFVVAPGIVDAGMAWKAMRGPQGESIRRQYPMGRVAEPEEVANTVLFLSGSGTDALTGGIIDINGASHLRQ